MRGGLPGHRTGWNRRPRSGDGGNDFIAQGGAAAGALKWWGPVVLYAVALRASCLDFK